MAANDDHTPEDEGTARTVSAPLQFDPTNPFAVPENVMEVLRTRTPRRPAPQSVDADDVDHEHDADEDDRDGAAPEESGRGGRERRRRRSRGRDRDRDEDRADAADQADDDRDERDEDALAEDRPAVSRRRRKRRRGTVDMELDGGEDGDPENTVTRVRAPRQSAAALSDTVQGVKGSTRLEAKRQRRRDSRTGGRRRTVITEAEFLARRESVDRKMLVRQRDNRIQIAVLEDGVLAEHFVSNTTQDSLIGNVYLGKVQNVLPSMEAAFVDIGRGRNAVLYAGEVNWDAAQLDGKPKKIENALKSGDTVLVQVTKDPVGHKGARLTSQISLPGRYLVYVPGGSMTGISRKLPDVERARLKRILKDHLPQDAGVIVRTAAEGTSEQELQNDINRLRAQWEGVQAKADSGKVLAPELLSAEPDLTIKTVRDVFNEDFSAMLVQGEGTWDNIEAYVMYVAPHLLDRLHHWVPEDHDGEDLYATHRVDEQLHKALDRKVYLPSGGSLVIDRTEAMTVVDVNTGKFTGSGGNLEETVTKNNLEAAEEIVRQLRLRDIGGIIVIDFIDMVLEANRDLVLRRLVECLGRDRTKHQVAEVTSLGLVQMTRKRMGTGLVEVFSETCEHCAGRGILIHDAPVERGRAQAESRSEGDGRRRRRRRGAEDGSEAGAESAAASSVEATEEERLRRERAAAARAALQSIAKATVKVEDQQASEGGHPADEGAAAAEDAGQERAAAAEEDAAGEAPAEASGPASESDEEQAGRRRKRRGRRRGRGRGEDAADVEDTARAQDEPLPDDAQRTAPEPDAEDEPGVAHAEPGVAREDAAAVTAAPTGEESAAEPRDEEAGPEAHAEAHAEHHAEEPAEDEVPEGSERRGRRRRGGRGRSRRAEGRGRRLREDGDPAGPADASQVDAPEVDAPEEDSPAPVEESAAETAGVSAVEAPAEPEGPAVITFDGQPVEVPRRRRGPRRASSDGAVRPGADLSRIEAALERRGPGEAPARPAPETPDPETPAPETPAEPTAPVAETGLAEPLAEAPAAEPEVVSAPGDATAAAAPARSQAPRRRVRRAVSSDGRQVQVQEPAAAPAAGARFRAAAAAPAAPEPTVDGTAPVMLGVGVKAADLARRP